MTDNTELDAISEQALEDLLTVYESFGPIEAAGRLRRALEEINSPAARLFTLIRVFREYLPLFTQKEALAMEAATRPYLEPIQNLLTKYEARAEQHVF